MNALQLRCWAPASTKHRSLLAAEAAEPESAVTVRGSAVDPRPFNPGVVGSNPTRPSKYLIGPLK